MAYLKVACSYMRADERRIFNVGELLVLSSPPCRGRHLNDVPRLIEERPLPDEPVPAQTRAVVLTRAVHQGRRHSSLH